MTYKELYDKALWDLEHDNMTLGEFDRITEPLNKEIPKEEQTDGDLISRQDVEDAIAETIVNGESLGYGVANDILSGLPTITSLEQTVGDLISKSVFDQIRWERDVAIDQLKDLGYELGEKPRTDGDLISRDYEIQQIQKAKESNYNFNYDTLIDFIKVLPSAEKTVNKININECIKVKLTDYGKDIFYHQYDNFNKTYGKEIIKPYYPTVDSDGYTSFQLWDFMNIYGKYFDMGIHTDMQNVIEPLEIVFESEEKTAEWILFDEDKNIYECSSCKEPFILMVDTPKENNYNYCPNCGAKMKVK